MNPAPDPEDWLDAVQSQRLSPEEVEQLRHHLRSRPRERIHLEEELLLNCVLDGLPRPTISSNFLARVEARIADEDRASARGSLAGWNWLSRLQWVRPISAVVVTAIALGGWWQFRLRERASLATSLAVVSQAAGMPGVDSLQDFDAVQLLRTTAQASDLDLLAALNTGPTEPTP